MKKGLVIGTALAVAFVMADARRVRAGSCSRESRAQRGEVESILDGVALTHSLDPALLAAIARVESDDCEDAVSPKGAAGLMQLMPATAIEFGVEDRFDPVQSALGAARFIDYLKRARPEGALTLPEILAAYNAGEAAVARAGGIPHYRETEEYVRRVLWIYLLGRLPESQRARSAALEVPQPSAPHPSGARHVPAQRHYADNDTAILEQLSELRRAREASPR